MSQILVGEVSRARQIIASCGDPLLAEFGLLGEIRYLVSEQPSDSDIEIYDLLLGPAPHDSRKRGLIEHHDFLSRNVGRVLLKAGLSIGRRQCEIYIDASNAQIVHSTGIHRPKSIPAELVQSTVAEQAEWIFVNAGNDSWSEGERVVNLLLAEREIDSLSQVELKQLAKAYNWWGRNADAFGVAKRAIKRFGPSDELLDTARLYLRNECIDNFPRYLSICDECIREQIGPQAYWHLLKADRYIELATGECEIEDFEWATSAPILHPELILPAAVALRAALDIDPDLRSHQKFPRWTGDWNSRFAAVLTFPEHQGLRK